MKQIGFGPWCIRAAIEVTLKTQIREWMYIAYTILASHDTKLSLSSISNGNRRK